MARRKVPQNLRWQIIGMRNAGLSCREIARQIDRHHSVVTRLVQKFQATNDVRDRPRTGRPRKTTRREDASLLRLVRRNPFMNSTILRSQWLPGRAISTRTIRNRLKTAGYRARRPIRRPLLTPVNRRARLQWARQRQRWNLASWRRVHFSDESRFLLHVVDGRSRVWRRANTALAERNIAETIPFGGGSVMVWGCVSHDCKLDLVTVQGNLNGQRYEREILETNVIPHFDNHVLADHPIFMDDNARPHRARAVVEFLRGNAIETIPWPARSPDINPIEHVWDILGRQVRNRDPFCANCT